MKKALLCSALATTGPSALTCMFERGASWLKQPVQVEIRQREGVQLCCIRERRERQRHHGSIWPQRARGQVASEAHSWQRCATLQAVHSTARPVI